MMIVPLLEMDQIVQRSPLSMSSLNSFQGRLTEQ